MFEGGKRAEQGRAVCAPLAPTLSSVRAELEFHIPCSMGAPSERSYLGTTGGRDGHVGGYGKLHVSRQTWSRTRLAVVVQKVRTTKKKPNRKPGVWDEGGKK